MTKPMIKVLFVCSGNICRSPMAEAIFRHMVDEAGLSDQVQTDSAGTGSWHIGERPHRGTQNVLTKHGIQYEGRARRLEPADLDTYDYVLGMDSSNVRGIRRYLDHNDRTEVRHFLHYANGAGMTSVTDVPDPYYAGNFDRVYELVRKGCEALLDHLRTVHDL